MTTSKLTSAKHVVASLMALFFSLASADGRNGDFCLAREGRMPIIGPEHTSLYERKLFVTKDDVARYVFLTNSPSDGDRSAAVYQSPKQTGSLPGDYWITSTEASTSLLDCIPTAVEKARIDLRGVKVRRADAPIPATTARSLHELWMAVIERSRIEERAVPFSPTGIFIATTSKRLKIRAVTAWRSDHSFCDALVDFGESLIAYTKLSPPNRLQAAADIEKQCSKLLVQVQAKTPK